MIMMKYYKNAKTWGFVINLLNTMLGVQCLWVYQRQVTFTLCKEALHSLTQCEWYPHQKCYTE